MTIYFKAHISIEDKPKTILSYVAGHDIARLEDIEGKQTRVVLKTAGGVSRKSILLNLVLDAAFEKINAAPENGSLDLTGFQAQSKKPSRVFGAAA